MLAFGRDYNRPVAETRHLEQVSQAEYVKHTGETLLGWPEYQTGRVAIVFSTLFAAPARRSPGGQDTLAYDNYDQAHLIYRKQLDSYHELAERSPEHFRFISNQVELEKHLSDWSNQDKKLFPVGLIPLMEGAEGVRTPEELEQWWDAGLRQIGLAWAGTRFCGGTREPGPLTDDGLAMLEAMASFGFTLDLSHMDALSARQALDMYDGPVMVSHANAAALLQGYDGNRLLPDDVINGVIERNGVIGVVPFCAFLKSGWKKGDSRDEITLNTLASHVDHICQMAGDARHVGLGTDFDGGFGLDAVPVEIDSIADVQKLGPVLQSKGYSDEDVEAILGMNWIRHLRSDLPK